MKDYYQRAMRALQLAGKDERMHIIHAVEQVFQT
jgi:hypothetical protein